MDRPRELHVIGGIGLELVWYRTKGPCNRTLPLIFGQTSTPLYKWLKFARCIMLSVYMDDADAKIRLPTADEVAKKRFVSNTHIVMTYGQLLMD